MFDAAISSTKWIVDTLIQKRSENKTIKRDKWIQVSDYLDNVAKLIDESIDFLKSDEIPYGNFAHLVEIAKNFRVVLNQVYDKKKDAEIIEKLVSNLNNALYMFILLDIAHAANSRAISSEVNKENTVINLNGLGSKIYPSLSGTAGQFHGAASTLRALA